MVCLTMVQVTNVSPTATTQQMKELFSYMGDIVEIKVYPDDTEADEADQIPSKVCFVSFKEPSSCDTALHLTNTIFIDRALIVARSRYDSIPDKDTAMSLAAPSVAVANQPPTVGHTAPLLPTPPSVLGFPPGLAAAAASVQSALISLPTTVLGDAFAQEPRVNLTPTPGIQVPISTPPAPAALQAQQKPPGMQPLISLMGTIIPQPPPLTGNVDPTKIEEIRRTVYVGNLNSNLTAEQVLTFFQPCGEIKYVRMAGDETQPTRFAFVEFSTPDSVPIALQYNGAMFGDRPIKVNHSKNAIVKPQGPTPQEQKREVEEAMKKVREAQQAIASAIEPPAQAPPPEKKKRSKSRSRSRSRSRGQLPGSPPVDMGRILTKGQLPGSPPVDMGRILTKSRDRRRRRSRSRDRYRYRRSRSRSPRRRRSYSRSPPRRRRRSRSHSRSPVRRYGSGRSYHRGRSRSRSYSPPRRRDRRTRRRSRSPPGRYSRRSPSPSPPPRKPRSSKRKERSPSRSPSPFEEYGPDRTEPTPVTSTTTSRKSKKSKKEKKYRKKPSPSPSPSPVQADSGSRRSSSVAGGDSSDMEVGGGSPPPKEPDSESDY